MSLFSIDFPEYTDGMTYDEFKMECLKRQSISPAKERWWRRVSSKYLIPLLLTDPKSMSIFDDVYIDRWYYGGDAIKKIMPPHMRDYFAFEMMLDKCPEIIDVHLGKKFLEKQTAFHGDINEKKRVSELLDGLESLNKSLEVKFDFMEEKGNGRYVSKVTVDEYTYDKDKQTLTVSIPKNVNFGKRTAMKVFGSDKKWNWRRRTYDYTTLQSWDVDSKRRFTLRRNVKKTKKYGEVIDHDEDMPLLIRLNFYPQGSFVRTRGYGHPTKDLFQGEAPIFKVNDKTGDVIDQQKKCRVTVVVSDNTPKRTRKTKQKASVKKAKNVVGEDSDMGAESEVEEDDVEDDDVEEDELKIPTTIPTTIPTIAGVIGSEEDQEDTTAPPVLPQSDNESDESNDNATTPATFPMAMFPPVNGRYRVHRRSRRRRRRRFGSRRVPANPTLNPEAHAQRLDALVNLLKHTE